MANARTRSFSVDNEDYPFREHWFIRKHVAMHYVDEGQGITILMLHGNPTWSFMYRHVIKGLRDNFRIIAPDYIGFGFSDKPMDYGYTPQEHVEWVNALVSRLKLDKVILMVHDWGGPIGMAVALDNLNLIQ